MTYLEDMKKQLKELDTLITQFEDLIKAFPLDDHLKERKNYLVTKRAALVNTIGR
jgi:hypothetical protein